jgi:hypothetical protein
MHGVYLAESASWRTVLLVYSATSIAASVRFVRLIRGARMAGCLPSVEQTAKPLIAICRALLLLLRPLHLCQIYELPL